jgi:hypothetical protein
VISFVLLWEISIHSDRLSISPCPSVTWAPFHDLEQRTAILVSKSPLLAPYRTPQTSISHGKTHRSLVIV